MKPCSSSLLILFTLAPIAYAGVREEVDYHHLVSYTNYFAASLPSGTGVELEMVEAPESGANFMPNAGDAQLNHATITKLSSSASSNSSHATTVAKYYFGSSFSLSPQSDTIGVRNANEFVNNVILNIDPITSLTGPVDTSSTAEVRSHAYIFRKSDFNDNINTINVTVRRFDYYCQATNSINVVGMNNGNSTTIPPGWGSAYNAISVGRSDGLHSHGFTDAALENGGRQKPDLVAPTTATSWAVGFTSSAATLLYNKAVESGNSDASHQNTIKACLMAGATKEEFPTWSQAETQPLDTTYGAGQLNIYNSYRIISLPEASTSSASYWGWARNTLPSTGSPDSRVRTYTFTTPNYPDGTFSLSAALVWLRPVSAGTYTYGTLSNYKLELLDGSSSVLQTSDSSLDNIEHIWRTTLLPNTTYSLRVSGTGTDSFSLAWRCSHTPLQPVAGTVDVNPSTVDLSFNRLHANVPYVVQRSTSLLNTSWSDIGNFTPSTASGNFTDNSPVGGDKAFYRLLPVEP